MSRKTGLLQSRVSLLPVELLTPQEGSTSTGFDESELVATNQLKVAKWENAFEGTASNPTVKGDFNELDLDRFYLRVPMPWNEGQGTGTAKIKVEGNDGVTDPENDIELVEIPGEPGVFRTHSLILVSNDVDDAYPDGTDEGLDDTTHKARLGDKVTFTVPVPGGQAIVEADVPARGTLLVTSWRFPSSNTRTPQEVDHAMTIVEEIVAQIGLKVDHSPNEGDFAFQNGDGNMDLFRPLVENGTTFPQIPVDFTDEGKNFMEEHSDGGRLSVYFLNNLGFNAIAKGVALTRQFVSELSEVSDPIGYSLNYTDKAFIKDGSIKNPVLGFGGFDATEFIVAHELLHLPGNLGHNPSRTNLMYKNALQWQQSVTDQRRINKEQESAVFEVPRTYIQLNE